VGEVDGRPLWSYPRGRALRSVEAQEFRGRIWATVLRSSRTGDPGTDPALVVSARPLPPQLYWSAVRDIVPVEHVRRLLESSGAWTRTSGSGRGLVGAAAAIAWPGQRVTWEAIAYRRPGRVGLEREVDRASVLAAERRHPHLFLCHDPTTRRLLVAPHTACPILFGLRSTDRGSGVRALREVRSEPWDRWALFRTNQGTGDHLVDRPFDEMPVLGAGRWEGTVVALPTTRAGGHVAFPLADADGSPVTCLAFEPTKTLPKVAATLRPGDRVGVWGSRGADGAFRLEGLEIRELRPRAGRARPPECSECGRAMRSLGSGRGYRCRSCRRRRPPEAAVRTPVVPAYGVGVYHPTPSARRHLAPLDVPS